MLQLLHRGVEKLYLLVSGGFGRLAGGSMF